MTSWGVGPEFWLALWKAFGEGTRRSRGLLNLQLICLLYTQVRRAIFDGRRPNTHQRGPIMAQLVSRFFKDQTAATAIEYSLLAAGIALAIVAVVQALGTQVKVPFSTMSSALK
jgi:pilus assembly protein Flp/PilA